MASELLEDRLYRHRFDDGLLDLFVAAGLLAIGTAWVLDRVALGAIAPAMLVPLWPAARASLVEPRAGRVRFSEAREATERRSHGWTLAIGLGMFALAVAGFAAGPPTLARDAVAGLPATLIGVGGALAGVLFGLPRLVGYAAVMVGCGALAVAAGLEPGVSILLGGAVVALAGGIRFARFWRETAE